MKEKKKKITEYIKNSAEIIAMKANIISRVRDLDKESWAYYNDAKEMLNGFLWTNISPNTKRALPLAYATRSKGATGVYEIYVNKNIPPNASVPLELHEIGHIIFTHMSLREAQRDMIIKKILSFWPKIKESFDEDVLKNTSPHILANQIGEQILNIAMDMEINSRLFADDEIIPFKDAADIAYIYASVGSILSDETRLKAILEWLDNTSPNKGHMFRPVFPQEFGYPPGLDFNQYIDLILNQPKEFFKNLKKQMEEMARNQGRKKGKGQGNGDGQEDSDSDGNGQNQGNGGGKNKKNSKGNPQRDDPDSCDNQESLGDGKLSQDEIDQLKESYNDGNNENNQEAQAEAEEEADEIDEELERQEKENAGGDGSENGAKVVSSKRASHIAEGYSPVGHAKKKHDIVDIGDTKALTRILLNACYNKKKVIHDPDPVYYYNRRKYNSSLLITKYREKELYRPGNIYIVADCSGSVPMNEVLKIANVIKGIASKCGKKSRLVWWDTNLGGDMLLKNIEGPGSCGGTDIARGIDYVNEKYLKKGNDKLIVISDFCDSLSAWNNSLKKVKQDAIGLCWRDKSYGHGSHCKDYLLSVDGNRDDSAHTIKKLMEKMDITLVNI